ncbi:MAG: beta-N-acetylhexosaminidase [Deltaproteobacteria bacterium]|nr:beta-N-acetylhexosaminidase [Deltaproteobacteria bacterium]
MPGPAAGTPRKEPLEEAGRLLMIGFEGDDAAEAVSLAEEYRPAGFVIFSRNYPGSPDSLKALLSRISEGAARALKRPPLMAVDQEGGTVLRIPLEETRLPAASEMAGLAREKGPDALEELSFGAGRALRDLGFNFNLAPVLDVGSEGAYIGSRSFSRDPEEVALCAAAFFAGQRRAGLLTCAKHFPGLGQASADPHSALPVVDANIQDVWDRDLKPFRTLVARGVPAVMTTHALFRAVDPGLPGTISPRVVDLLKRDVGFKGLALTDDLEMGALSGTFPLGRAAADAVSAGHDLVLVCRGRAAIEEAREGLLKAVKDYDIAPSRLREAKLRLTRTLKRIA